MWHFFLRILSRCAAEGPHSICFGLDQTNTPMKSLLILFLRFLLLWRVGLVLYEQNSAMACRSTIIYVQNGTSLNTSRWYRNGFFGNVQNLPIPGTVKPSFDLENSANGSFSTVNPVLPKLPFFINPKQDCVCGLTKVSLGKNFRIGLLGTYFFYPFFKKID